MSGRLEGKTAVITAAAQGIGRATVEAFVREGARVWAADINADKLRELEALPGVTGRCVDVRDNEAVARFADEAGAVDILFNCAGFVHSGSILECSEADLDFALDLNVKSMFRTIRAFLPGMLDKGGGSIVNMSTVASSVKAVPARFAYSTSKAAVIGLTKSAATPFVPARWNRRRWRNGYAPWAIMKRRGRRSLPASRSAGWVGRRKSLNWWFISRRTWRPIPRGRSMSSTAVGRPDSN
jgi:NAD(P)-dependent dehydrogenase (short-subunit alcohol dehydrogenase family)